MLKHYNKRNLRVRKYIPAKFADVKLSDGFWCERLDTVVARTVPSQYQRLGEHGILGSLSLPKPVPELKIPYNQEGFSTQIFWDSDVGKWIEAASYILAHKHDDTIQRQIDEITDILETAQAPDGYLNCWYLGREPENRWTNLRDNHELYNAGHLLEGAIAYYEATGKRRLLDILERYIDHIADMFGTGANQKRGYPGHQEIELALIKLYHVTENSKHLDLAAYFINERGSQPHYFDIEREARGEKAEEFWQDSYEYNQSHKPVREQDKVVGHAVRAMYMYAAMADLAAELGDESLKSACELLWKDITETRMYVTGGFGSSASNEGFTADYDLPNDTAYAETCASVAMIYWAQRMLNMDLDGQYADILELALYNNALAGLSHGGEHYFYDNKLESDGSHKRWEWHHCPCCTMNVARLVASVGGYFYSFNDDTIAVHLYGGSEAAFTLKGEKVGICERSDYPWSGLVSLDLTLEKPTEFSLKLRIPGWTKDATVKVNDVATDVEANLENGYVNILRIWREGDRVELDLPMPAGRIYAHPSVQADFGRTAMRRGPFIYCVEQIDNANAPLSRLKLPRGSDIEFEMRKDLLEGIVTLVADGSLMEVDDWGHDLYRTNSPAESPTGITAVPYYAWCNRGSNAMRVWIKE
jgi:hypothetical protein